LDFYSNVNFLSIKDGLINKNYLFCIDTDATSNNYVCDNEYASSMKRDRINSIFCSTNEEEYNIPNDDTGIVLNLIQMRIRIYLQTIDLLIQVVCFV
jgi:hypothetical protein